MEQNKRKSTCREEFEGRLRKIVEELGEEEEELGEEEELDNKKKMRRKKRRLTMVKIERPREWYLVRRRELWDDRFREVYTMPTVTEFSLIEDYLYQFYWELPDFDESSQPQWLSIKNRLQSPNLRDDLIKFLDQIRGSKGFDVDVSFDFFNKDNDEADLYRVLFEHPSTEFVPRDLKLKQASDVAQAAGMVAIREINTILAKLEPTFACGSSKSYKRSYELKSVDKLVTAANDIKLVFARNHRETKSISEFLFLTLTATQKSFCVETQIVERECRVDIQALLMLCLDNPSPDMFDLLDWTPLA